VLTGGTDQSVRLWSPLRRDSARRSHSLPAALPVHKYTDGITHAVASVAVDEDTCVAASGQAVVWMDLVTGQLKRRFQGTHIARINHISFGNDVILSASYDATVCIWDCKSNSTVPIQRLKEAKDSVTWCELDDKLIRTTSVDGSLRTYDVRGGQLTEDKCPSPITGAASASDCVAVNCLDSSIRMIDKEIGGLVNEYSGSHRAGNYGLPCAITADDASVVTGSEDGSVCCYDLVRGTPLQRLDMKTTKPVCTLDTHPLSSSLCVAASFEGPGIVWGTNTDLVE